ncbi:MAG: alpha-glucan family phosphorylase [Calditerrivibrio sp.]|nr:alpha-glucan family phosphorylase [Calditerrivibrio sp.]MCA1933410.1 alpha-glucan family phosphorylase [Calditerrivibrio sp.]
MKRKEFFVKINFPDRLKSLESLAYNLWWVYNNNAKDLFKMINPDLWRESDHNPIEVLLSLSELDIKKLEKDQVFLSRLDTVWNEYLEYLKTPKWFETVMNYEKHGGMQVAYFSAEYGLHESIQSYAGGLGILSGDHFKSASDLGIPFVAVGLLYRNGYFHQYLNSDGWQLETYPYNEFYKMPVTEAYIGDDPVVIEIPTYNGVIKAKVWLIHLGYSRLVMLDTDLDDNSPENRVITGKLYDGDSEMRIKQEIVLGIGGVRALKKLGIEATVFHINEGHPAFALLERVKDYMTDNNLNLSEAINMVKHSTLFTTHTPVPAGFDVFDNNTIYKHLSPIYGHTPLSVDEILKIGKVNPYNHNEIFSMAVCATKLSVFRNGVSKLHGKVSRQIFNNLWPEVGESFVPVGHVTNGIHLQTWLADEIKVLFNRYLGEDWYLRPYQRSVWDNVEDIPDLELYEAKNILRTRLVEFIRKRTIESIRKRGGSYSEIVKSNEILHPGVLTIGFARRFATYKRGYLLFTDEDRLSRILNNPKMPVQIIIAGKAHPKDSEGKDIIKKIHHIARKPEFRDKIVFVEDYDIQVAKYLVRGVDVWLNNPRRPMEASGTSGMKAAVNGALNFSILDGWWVEGYKGDNGWSIGAGEEYSDPKYQDFVEGQELYDKLENEIVPLFYSKDRSGLPRGWIHMVKRSIFVGCSEFSTNRMVMDYHEKYYVTLHEMCNELVDNNFSSLKEYMNFYGEIFNKWQKIRFIKSEVSSDKFYLGSNAKFTAEVYVDDLTPDYINVCVISDTNCPKLDFEEPRFIILDLVEQKDNVATFSKTIKLTCSGKIRFAFAIFPKHKYIFNEFENNLVVWEK